MLRCETVAIDIDMPPCGPSVEQPVRHNKGFYSLASALYISRFCQRNEAQEQPRPILTNYDRCLFRCFGYLGSRLTVRSSYSDGLDCLRCNSVQESRAFRSIRRMRDLQLVYYGYKSQVESVAEIFYILVWIH